MIQLKRVGVPEIKLLVDYFYQNQESITNVVNDFGPIAEKNGYGTFFLNPSNDLFKVFWIHQKENKINLIGFGGPNLGLTVKDISDAYSNHTEGYIIHDSEYRYAFYNKENYDHLIRITSPVKIFEKGELKINIQVNGIEIVLEKNEKV